MHAAHLRDAALLEETQKEKEQQVSRCNHFEETYSQLRLEMSQQKEKHETELEGLRAEIKRLTDELSIQSWDKAAAESQLLALRKKLQESSS